MNAKIMTIVLTAAAALPLGYAVAGPMRERPNLRAAERELTQAFEHVAASQAANEWDEGGHAQKAKELIEHAKEEIHLAAEWDGHRR